MKLVRLAVVLALALVPSAALADDLCGQLGKALDLVKTGFGPAEGDPLPNSDGHYRRSTIQLSDGENCAIEEHRVLSCSWEPSTAKDLKKMVSSIAACFPDARRKQVKIDPDGPPDVTFTLDRGSIELGLTADVMSLNVGP